MRALPYVVAILVVVACSESRRESVVDAAVDQGMSDDGALASPDGGADASVTDLGGADAGPTCDPVSGTEEVTASCDSLQLNVFHHDDAPSTVELRGRVSTVSDDTCAQIDSVEITRGTTVLATLTGAGAFPFDFGTHTIAHGNAFAEIETTCASDSANDRFNSYGVVVHGRVNGATVRAECGTAGFGGRWPAEFHVACHRNVAHPVESMSASEQTTTFSGMSIESTSLFGAVRHGSDDAVTHLDGNVFVMVYAMSGGALPSISSSGWTAFATESGVAVPRTDLQLSLSESAFGRVVCPDSGGTEPFESPPVLLVRMTGTNAHGPVVMEGFVDRCTHGVLMH